MCFDQSRYFIKVLLVICLCIWFFVVFQISAFASRFDTVISATEGFESDNLPSVGTFVSAPAGYSDLPYQIQAPTAVNQYANSYSYTYIAPSVQIGSSGPVITQLTYFYYVLNSNGRYNRYYTRYPVAVIPGEFPNIPVDSDSDGINDDIDPCPDSYDEKFKLWRSKNICTGSYYLFQITGECGVTKTYYNPIYNSEQSAYADALANPECNPPSAIGSVSITAKQFEDWYDQHHFDVNVGGASPDEALPDQSIPDPTGGNSTVHIPPKPVDASDPDSQKVIDQIERMKLAVEQAIHFSGQNVAGQVQVTGDQIVSGLKGVKDAVNGLSMGGVSTAVNSAAATAHSDSQAMLEKLEEIKNKPVANATASATLELPSVSVSGSFTIPESGVLDPVSEDRVIAAKERFVNAWDNLKNSFSGIFDVNLYGSGSLPVWIRLQKVLTPKTWNHCIDFQ